MNLKLVGILFIAALAAAGGFWGGRQLANRHAAEEASRIAALHAAEAARLRGQAVAWADALARGQGEAVLRSFASGISPAILSERRESLELSAVSLLRVKGIAGIHVVRPDGTVLYSSDAKLTTTGNAGEGGAWALAATELASRPSARAGFTELAVPIEEGGRVLAVVWMEFAHGEVRDAGRPEGFGGEAAPPTAI